MKRAVVAFVIAFSCAARADVPPGVTQRIIRFVNDGCDFFKASPLPSTIGATDKKLAAHFGRIVKSEREGTRVRYALKTNALEGWDVSFWARGIDIKFPSTVAITIGDLSRFLGPDDSPDVDYAVSATTSMGTRSEVEDREFKPLVEHGHCLVTVGAEADRKKGAARRVFSLRFGD